MTLAETPLNLKKLLVGRDNRLAVGTRRFGDKSGWHVADGTVGIPGEGYLLLARYDGTAQVTTVELVDLTDLKVRHRWQPDAPSLFAGVPDNAAYADKHNRRNFEAVHPLLLADGSLIVKDHHTPLFRIDRCGQPVWSEASQIYHHSTEMDAEGTLWVPVHLQPPKKEYGPDFVEDGLARVSADGKVLEVRSLVDIYRRHGLSGQLFGSAVYNNDPLHLNDIQPVLADGPYWKKGDLFLSTRHNSTVLLYRPSTDQIVWRRQGPWLGQHDVDILDDHRIRVFDNNALNRGNGPEVMGNNNILIYDFRDDSLSAPYSVAMVKNDVSTFSEGLDETTPAGNFLVEEENSGRVLILSAAGDLLAEYVNRSADGQIWTTSWSRPVSRADGDAALAAMAAAPPCSGI
ncbi:MAG: hypothetical protein JSR87_03870 [Proteobacteria bacterium]|nr:hypothetical protein [Pseudomonadota bacterium]MBS0572018.1 hypothetical protein [Pseudomonadota bacterium]